MKKALFWANKGAEKGDASCYELIADSYLDGDYVEKDIIKAIAWLEKGIDDLDCRLKLAEIYCFNEEYKNLDKGIELLETLNVLGGRNYNYANAYLGIINYKVFKDYDKAFEYFNKVDKSRNVEDSNYYLGECYYYGRGVECNYNLAFKYYKIARHSIDAEFRLAECYGLGLGTNINTSKALEICNKLLEKLSKNNDQLKCNEINHLIKKIKGGNPQC